MRVRRSSTMKIRSIDKDIKDILESGFYRIPRFQRPYSWDLAKTSRTSGMTS